MPNVQNGRPLPARLPARPLVLGPAAGPPRAVGVLVGDRGARARIAQALQGRYRVVFLDEPADVTEAVAAGRVGMVLVEPVAPGGRSHQPLVARIRGAYPSVPVVAYCAVRAGSSQIMAMARAGACELVLAETDDVRLVLDRVLDGAECYTVAEYVLGRLRGRVPATVLPIVQHFLEHGTAARSVVDAAAALGVHRRTLVKRLTVARCPPPRVLASWARLLVAARWLDDPGRSVECVALDLDFPSGTALRNMVKRYTGLTPAQLRAVGALRVVADALVAECAGPAPRAQAVG